MVTICTVSDKTYYTQASTLKSQTAFVPTSFLSSKNQGGENSNSMYASTSLIFNQITSNSDVEKKVKLAPKNAKATIKNQKLSDKITKDNFKDYFLLNGSPHPVTYDVQTGILTLTPDSNNQVGVATLKGKISSDHNFTLKGRINIGTKGFSRGGMG